VERLLRGLLHDLEQRCAQLRDRVAAIQAGPDVCHHALLAYRLLERLRRDIAQLLADPSLGAPVLRRNHLQLYKRWHEWAALIESYPLPFVERYTPRDRRLTRLCMRLAEQVRWPTPLPLVATFSSHYYWTMPDFGLICAPAGEGTTLLGLPDLCHELGHILLWHHQPTLLGDFVHELAAYIRREQQRVAAQQRPPEYRRLYDRLFAQWHDAWLREFAADMIATYLVGPAFGWQHLRLCAGRSQSAYHPTLDEAAEHPADHARLRGVLAVLMSMGMADAAARLRSHWQEYLAVSGETPPADYDVCYPHALVASLARRTVEGCRKLGVRGIDEPREPHEVDDLPMLLNQAWERFLSDPASFSGWAAERLHGLWRGLDVELDSPV
jgi:hypothetical protein